MDYAVEHLWLLTSAVYAIGGGELRTPRYIEMAYPEIKYDDTRTAEQIKEHVLQRLAG